MTHPVRAPGATAWRAGAVAIAAVAALAAPGMAGTAAAAVPEPPPLRVDPPAGRPPGAASGVRSPERCDPPPPAEDGPDSGAARLQLADVHRLATGRGRLIAMIDTGVYPHPLLGGRLRGGGDYITGGDGLDDCDGHGTAVAGLLAAGPDPGPTGRGSTPIGIAPGAELLSIRQSSPSFDVAGPDGTYRPAGDIESLADAIVLAVRARADVVNISEAVCLPPDRAAAEGSSLHAALGFAAEADVVVVAAAGNIGPSCAGPGSGQVSLPGWYDDELLTVGAVEPDDTPAGFTVPGPWVDVAAPGSALRSLAVGGGTTTTGTDGTSFAAPYVAGLAALVRERFPDLTAPQVADRILATARRPSGGENDLLGHGVIDPVAALTAVPDVLSPGAGRSVHLADLPGTAPAPPPPSTPWPVDLAAVAALLAAGSLATWLLRRNPAAPDPAPRGGPPRPGSPRPGSPG